MIEVKVLREAGYEEAMFGISLNKNQPIENMPIVAARLSSFDGGHNKFLEQIEVWLDVKAPRHWWQEADTYRLSSKNSQSTMHTLMKRNIEQTDFEEKIPDSYLHFLNDTMKNDGLIKLKAYLPEGFMQRRMWKMSYKTLRNIIQQRKNHRLPHWKTFVEEILKQVEHPILLMKTDNEVKQ